MYKKPVLVSAEDMAEGVFAASGSANAKAWIVQRPELGRYDFRLRVEGNPGGTTEVQIFTVTFNQAVEYEGGDWPGTASGNTVTITRSNHANPGDNINFNLIVKSQTGLEVVSASVQAG